MPPPYPCPASTGAVRGSVNGPDGFPDLWRLVLEQARNEGLRMPMRAASTSGSPTLVDGETGECYEIGFRLRKI